MEFLHLIAEHGAAVTCLVALAGAVLFVAWFVFVRPSEAAGPPHRRRNARLMNQVMGDQAKYDRLVRFHGSAEAASASIEHDIK